MRISYWSSDVCSSDLLVVDPNRGLDNPTLMPEVSDGTVVPGNRALGAAERRARVDTFYHPYHAAIAAKLDELLDAGREPAPLSVNSFTPRTPRLAQQSEVRSLWPRDPHPPHPLHERPPPQPLHP